jgi:hypothetical protein
MTGQSLGAPRETVNVRFASECADAQTLHTPFLTRQRFVDGTRQTHTVRCSFIFYVDGFDGENNLLSGPSEARNKRVRIKPELIVVIAWPPRQPQANSA